MKNLIVFISIIALGATACKENESVVTLPTVTTGSISNITSTSGTGGGNVTSDGGDPVTTRGVCWSTSQNPATTNSKTVDGSGTGTFISSIIGLNENTTYYVRAYAIIGTSHWVEPNAGANNETKFTALPGGSRTSGGAFINISEIGRWWSSTEYSSTKSWHREMNTYFIDVTRSNDEKIVGFSVRCVKD
jgi:hypothetical protein